MGAEDMKALNQKNLFVALASLMMTIFLANCSHCGHHASADKAKGKASCCATKNASGAEEADHARHEHKGGEHHHHDKDHKHAKDCCKTKDNMKKDCCVTKNNQPKKDCCVTKNGEAKKDCCKTKSIS